MGYHYRLKCPQLHLQFEAFNRKKKRLPADWNQWNCPVLCLQSHYREAKVQQSPKLCCLLSSFCPCCYSINDSQSTHHICQWLRSCELWVQIMQQRESLINRLTNISQATAQPSSSFISTSVWWWRPNCPALKHLHLSRRVRCVICQQSQIKVDVFTDDRQVVEEKLQIKINDGDQRKQLQLTNYSISTCYFHNPGQELKYITQ